MKLQRTYKNFNMFHNGVNFAGRVNTVTPPNPELILETFRGGGMDAGIEVDMGMNPLSASFVMNDYAEEIWTAFGLTGGQKSKFSFRGALQEVNGVNAIPIEFYFTGVISSQDVGELAAGQPSRPTHNITSIDYYKFLRNNVVIHEIDIINGKRIIDGVDQIASINEALGNSNNVNISNLTESVRSQNRRAQAESILTELGF